MAPSKIKLITAQLTFLLLITVGFNRRIELTKIRALAQYFWCRAKAQFFLILTVG